MRKIVRWGAGALLVLLACAQSVRPARTNPPIDPARTLVALRPMPPDVARTFDAACRDCHSNDTRWPWYSHVAPISWFVIDHVNHGRSHFNVSDWAGYEPAEAARLLKKSCELVEDRSMPLGSYLLVHRSARVSPPARDALCAWAREGPESR